MQRSELIPTICNTIGHSPASKAETQFSLRVEGGILALLGLAGRVQIQEGKSMSAFQEEVSAKGILSNSYQLYKSEKK